MADAQIAGLAAGTITKTVAIPFQDAAGAADAKKSTPQSLVDAVIGKIYNAKVSQSSTSAPDVLGSDNASGATITWARAAGGFFTITASSAVFTANKTLIQVTGCGSGGYSDIKFFTTQVSSTTVINLGAARSDGTFEDGFIIDVTITILN